MVLGADFTSLVHLINLFLELVHVGSLDVVRWRVANHCHLIDRHVEVTVFDIIDHLLVQDIIKCGLDVISCILSLSDNSAQLFHF